MQQKLNNSYETTFGKRLLVTKKENQSVSRGRQKEETAAAALRKRKRRKYALGAVPCLRSGGRRTWRRAVMASSCSSFTLRASEKVGAREKA